MRAKRKKKQSKKEAQRLHFEKRSLERVGVVLDRKEIIRQIQNGQLEFYEKQSNRVSLFKYFFNGEEYRIVYDRERKQVVTILYKEEVWSNKTK